MSLDRNIIHEIKISSLKKESLQSLLRNLISNKIFLDDFFLLNLQDSLHNNILHKAFHFSLFDEVNSLIPHLSSKSLLYTNIYNLNIFHSIFNSYCPIKHKLILNLFNHHPSVVLTPFPSSQQNSIPSSNILFDFINSSSSNSPIQHVFDKINLININSVSFSNPFYFNHLFSNYTDSFSSNFSNSDSFLVFLSSILSSYSSYSPNFDQQFFQNYSKNLFSLIPLITDNSSLLSSINNYFSFFQKNNTNTTNTTSILNYFTSLLNTDSIKPSLNFSFINDQHHSLLFSYLFNFKNSKSILPVTDYYLFLRNNCPVQNNPSNPNLDIFHLLNSSSSLSSIKDDYRSFVEFKLLSNSSSNIIPPSSKKSFKL